MYYKNVLHLYFVFGYFCIAFFFCIFRCFKNVVQKDASVLQYRANTVLKFVFVVQNSRTKVFANAPKSVVYGVLKCIADCIAYRKHSPSACQASQTLKPSHSFCPSTIYCPKEIFRTGDVPRTSSTCRASESLNCCALYFC